MKANKKNNINEDYIIMKKMVILMDKRKIIIKI